MRRSGQLSFRERGARPATLFKWATILLAVLVASTALSFAASPSKAPAAGAPGWLAPSALVITSDGTVLVACAKGQRLDFVDSTEGKLKRSVNLPGQPSGMALAADGQRLYVTCAGPQSQVCELALPQGSFSAEWKTGHTALNPVLSADGKRLYVCLRFDGQIAVFDVEARREAARIPVGREPVSAALTPDNRFLFVAHHLPSGRADGPAVAATVGVVDLGTAKMTKELRLPNGSSLLRQIRLSPDGRYALVAHNLAHYQVPTTQLERGWMNTSAFSIIDVQKQRLADTVLLDELDRGAANPWALVWSPDGQQLLITHAGTHELSVIDFPALLAKLAASNRAESGNNVPADDLAFLTGLRGRIKLAGNGPRSMALSGHQLYVADYFSDTVEEVDLGRERPLPRVIPLPGTAAESTLRKGERLFNDATVSFQGWQSCATCHSEDARVDGLNWDLLNDGLGNPKNTKSLLLAHATPPAMSTGVRYSAQEAVRAGIQHILFASPSEELAAPLDAWLRSLEPIPSPHLVNGQPSAAARRGQKIFKNPKIGCITCHPPPLFTNLKSYDVGTAGPLDRGAQFDTPTLIELWRTAPYLHDGSAASLRDVLTTCNSRQQHGHVSHLTEPELNDLIEFLLSL